MNNFITKPKHTPAPWRYDSNIPQVEAFYPNGNRSLQVIISCSPEEYEANASLIAAAPELLEALECIFFKGRSIETMRKATEAIAKARGE